MVDPQASRFWRAALQSGLIDAGGLNTCWDAIVPEKRTVDQIDRRMARQAVQKGMLTLWQAQQLLAGRSSGFKIDRYLLLEMIGQGGMGRVYLAKDSRLNRQVALKILSPERVNNPRAIQRFQREARVGAQLQHEHLVRVYDEGEANGKCYLVMEYIQGKNIGSIIAEKGPIPPSTAARLARQVALGLEHAQQKGLIHRDVNPYNILVTQEGTAKLTDLGLAIDLADQAAVTREGATVGTFDYVSPEQARHSHSVDTRSDIYSLGCTLYHMLTGQVPYPSPSLPEKLFGHQAVEPESIRLIVPDVPEGLEEVVRKMMRKAPADRYPTPLELAQALEPFTDDPSAGSSRFDLVAPGSGVDTGRASQSSTKVSVVQRGRELAVTEMFTPVRERAPSASGIELPPDLAAIGPGAPPREDRSGLNLGLDFGPKLPAPEIKTRPSAPPEPEKARPSAPSATPEAKVEPPLDFTKFTEAAPPSPKKKEPGGFDLGLDFGPRTTPAEPASRAKDNPPTPPPVAEAKVTPPPRPVPVPEPEPEVDFAALASGKTRPKEDLSGLGLGLDLGPAPPLSQSSSRARAEPTPAPAGVSGKAKSSARGLDRRWIGVGAAAVLLIAAVTGGLLASGVLGGPGKPPPPSPSKKRGVETRRRPTDEPKPRPEISSTTKPSRPRNKKLAPKEPEIPEGEPIAVRSPDGTLSMEPSLKSAIQRAIGSKGHVLLNNREPLRLSGADAEINAAGGPLYIRAAKGVQPVLEVELGKNPFLLTRTDTPITVVGVTIVAHSAGNARNVPPLIEAGGKVTLDRCAFRASREVKGSKAVAAEGGGLEATGCWFEGFDLALDVQAFGGSTTTLRQCMMVRARADDQPIGWAARVRSMPGGFAKTGRRLILEHCTARGEGLLDLVDFSPESPFKVEITGCAVLADALLAWEGPKSEGSPTAETLKKALEWKGQGNQYDVRGKSWMVLSPMGTPELPGGPTDLASWSTLAAETDPVPPPIKFQDAASESPKPADFAIADQAAGSTGADPEQVGPSAKPAMR